MFRTLNLTNFMKYESHTFAFTDGINVVRGASEAGKSTMLRALLYALGGVRATGLAADELVRWGARAAHMSVVLDIHIDGVTYNIKRAPSGAEIRFTGRDEPDVVGQTEVTEFAMRLIRTDLAGLQNLMFASQNAMRGALEDGPAATVALIEQLAELGQVDELVQLVTTKLPSGATTSIEGRIANLQADLADLESKPQADIEAQRETVAVAMNCAQAGRAVRDAAVKALEAARAAADLAGTKARFWEDVAKNLQAATRNRDGAAQALASLHSTLDKLRVEADKPLHPLDPLRDEVAEAEGHSRAVAAFKKVQPFLALPSVFWDQPAATLDAEIAQTRAKIDTARAALATCEKDVAVAKSRITEAKTCTYCGKDVSQVPEVAARNGELHSQLEQAGKQAAKLVTQLQDAKGTLASLLEVQAVGSASLAAAAAAGGFVDVLDVTVPATLRWVGPDMQAAAPDLKACKARLSSAEAEHKSVEAARIRYDAEAARLPAAQEAALAAEKALKAEEFDTCASNLALTQQAVADALLKVQEARLAATEADREASDADKVQRDAETALIRMEMQAQADQDTAARMRVSLSEAEAEIDATNDTNQLIKDLRRVRPLVAERVWNIVLAAVSSHFSEMRGEDSIIQREGRAFTCNGKSIAGLSGSTKDLLGLAIRLALTATFLPQARFLVLDEPWAACDQGRSERCLSFLTAAGFDQILLVTHESSSEAVADSLIQL